MVGDWLNKFKPQPIITVSLTESCKVPPIFMSLSVRISLGHFIFVFNFAKLSKELMASVIDNGVITLEI